ncbi:hypothetical protein [Thermoplasma volcanium GSS1]|uniref:Protein kinase domain-containing protein n=1 Tax=Thermoplasma volcanium (strain ATCC 51530 / DSM 4299 / JCM 9571 / NBRC 15438 / GSS1) TaxID=273116 RepID=Q97B74_THEVO|nr:RIO1 family regulatory kinase/ATPase [Thermoplasma volcanium]BAB59725.1 hypothetical protein [Thermoplasma volcanium GSS1]
MTTLKKTVAVAGTVAGGVLLVSLLQPFFLGHITQIDSYFLFSGVDIKYLHFDLLVASIVVVIWVIDLFVSIIDRKELITPKPIESTEEVSHKHAESTFTEVKKWPNQFEYSQAFQNPGYSFARELSGGTVIKNPNVKMTGNMIYSSGNYGLIFKIEKESKYYAIKCFTKGSDLHKRYYEIGKHIKSRNLSCIVNFEYLEAGVRTMKDPSIYYPVLKMDWIEGDSLYTYIKRNLDDGKEIRRIANEFAKSVILLKKNHIAHGDLSSDNIMISNGKVIFVDYDGMYVPSLKDLPSNENGHENFQHPSRRSSDYGEDMDNFSALVIYTSLYVLSLRPEAWKFNGDDPDALLFRKDDFLHYERSEVFDYIKKMGGKSAKLASLLIKSLQDGNVNAVEPTKFYSAK